MAFPLKACAWALLFTALVAILLAVVQRLLLVEARLAHMEAATAARDDEVDDYSNAGVDDKETTPEQMALSAERIRLNKLKRQELLQMVGPEWEGGKTKTELIEGILSRRNV